MEVLEEYNMGSITLEYRRECRQSDMLDSLTSTKTRLKEHDNDMISNALDLECTHLLRMQDDQAEIVRARTVWILKH